MKKIFSIFILFISCQSCFSQTHLPQNNDDNSLLWEIYGNGLTTPSYLFGTFHLLCKEDIHFSANILQAMHTADKVYFEMDLDDPANTLGAMLYINMKDKTLKELYTTAEYEKVAKFFSDSLKMNLSYFNKMKPMMLEALLYPCMMNCKNPSGVEMELLTIAKKDKKEIKGFETIEFQSSIFDSIPYDIQAKALLKDIDSTQKYKAYFNEMVNVYKSQQIDKLTKIIADTTFSDGENDDILLKNRNQNWVKQLHEILPKNNIFMAVGAGHLLGKDGLIALLRKDGYKVKPIANR